MLTIYHWDLPQALQNFGGWTNPKIVDYFIEYSRILFENYGHKVKFWVTINEPAMVCEDGYGTGFFAPFIPSQGIGNYLCAHHILLAHARAYHLYKSEYASNGGGEIGMSIDTDFSWPKNASNIEDIEAANRRFQFHVSI